MNNIANLIQRASQNIFVISASLFSLFAFVVSFIRYILNLRCKIKSNKISDILLHKFDVPLSEIEPLFTIKNENKYLSDLHTFITENLNHVFVQKCNFYGKVVFLCITKPNILDIKFIKDKFPNVSFNIKEFEPLNYKLIDIVKENGRFKLEELCNSSFYNRYNKNKII